MPFVVITIGILMIVVGIRNTQCQLGKMIIGDFTGNPNFWYWIGAIFIVGALGYIDEMKGPSRAMLALILVALILANKGFFQQFVTQLKQGSATPPPPGPPPPSIGTGGSGAGGSSVASGVGGIGSALGTAGQIAGALGIHP